MICLLVSLTHLFDMTYWINQKGKQITKLIYLFINFLLIASPVNWITFDHSEMLFSFLFSSNWDQVQVYIYDLNKHKAYSLNVNGCEWATFCVLPQMQRWNGNKLLSTIMEIARAFHLVISYLGTQCTVHQCRMS